MKLKDKDFIFLVVLSIGPRRAFSVSFFLFHA